MVKAKPMEQEVTTAMIATIPITFLVNDMSLNQEQEQEQQKFSGSSSDSSPLWIPLRLFRFSVNASWSSLTSPLHGPGTDATSMSLRKETIF